MAMRAPPTFEESFKESLRGLPPQMRMTRSLLMQLRDAANQDYQMKYRAWADLQERSTARPIDPSVQAKNYAQAGYEGQRADLFREGLRSKEGIASGRIGSNERMQTQRLGAQQTLQDARLRAQGAMQADRLGAQQNLQDARLRAQGAMQTERLGSQSELLGRRLQAQAQEGAANRTSREGIAGLQAAAAGERNMNTILGANARNAANIDAVNDRFAIRTAQLNQQFAEQMKRRDRDYQMKVREFEDKAAAAKDIRDRAAFQAVADWVKNFRNSPSYEAIVEENTGMFGVDWDAIQEAEDREFIRAKKLINEMKKDEAYGDIVKMSDGQLEQLAASDDPFERSLAEAELGRRLAGGR